MSKPKLCPRCHAKLEGALANVERVDVDGKISWDSFCKKCGWSENISPDIEEVEVL